MSAFSDDTRSGRSARSCRQQAEEYGRDCREADYVHEDAAVDGVRSSSRGTGNDATPLQSHHRDECGRQQEARGPTDGRKDQALGQQLPQQAAPGWLPVRRAPRSRAVASRPGRAGGPRCCCSR